MPATGAVCMATLEVYGFEDLQDALAKLANIPFDVIENALGSMADVAEPKIKAQGEAMGVRDPESDVHILDKIKRGKAKKMSDGGYLDITFSGSRTRNGITTRNAEIAFINEYGKQGQAARPFIGLAMNQNETKILDAAEEVIGDWIEKTFEA